MLLAPFLSQCFDRPNAVALVEGAKQIEFRELLAQAKAIAGELRGRGIGPGSRVAIQLDRGAAAVAAIFGVLLAGATYVPLDLRNPLARREWILRDADIAAIAGLGSPSPLEASATWLDVGSLSPVEGVLPVDSTPEEVAAILYTSGSTGQPKGVALSHGAIGSFADWAASLLDMDPSDRIASSAPFFFDLSTFDLFAALGRGATLCFLPAELTLAPARLAKWLAQEAISGWYTVPSLLAFLAYKGDLSGLDLSALRFLIFAGEVFPTRDLRRLADLLPTVDLYNFFGPTETNVCCCWPVDRSRLRGTGPIPIGNPASGAEFSIDDRTGELLVKGPSLFSGYWQNGRLAGALTDGGWYRTADRVSRNERGELLFHGRLSRMLKCSGYRVEPAEIEAAICGLAGAEACAVVGLDDPVAGQRPAAAVVLAQALTLAELQQALRRSLPAYMLPNRYRQVDELPKLSNGKVDYQSVKALLETVA